MQLLYNVVSFYKLSYVKTVIKKLWLKKKNMSHKIDYLNHF